jgi:ribosome biogenesis protein ERB1
VLLRTGDVPREWYALHDHTGYTVKGEKVVKPVHQDELEKFMER